MNTDNKRAAEHWTLTCAGVSRTAAEIGVKDLVRRRVSPGPEVCRVHTATAPGGEDVATFLAMGRSVTVARNGQTWFVGRVTGQPSSGGARHGRTQTYELHGPWWYLERLTAQQPQPPALAVRSPRTGGNVAWSSRFVVGQAADGTPWTTGQTMAWAMGSATAAGAPLQTGTIEPASLAPPVQADGWTCAQVVEAAWRWHPDCVGWFDHTTGPVPTWHCRARASLPVVTLAVGGAPLAAVRGITAPPGPGAAVVVVRCLEADGSASAEDAFPAGADGRGIGAMVLNVPASDGGPLVSGVAAALQAACEEAAAYRGCVVLVEPAGRQGATGATLGTTINLVGGEREEWATMRTPVVAEETSVAQGRTTLWFGAKPRWGEPDEGATTAE